ncbi:hypothetical protein K0504_00035 [Neiella marina]|uniref:Secreted protein n=1 Tax=Neiella holothuriorum TaxID=2870530 RepID=A0ABS7EAR5_9GAMM|nr:hypothetical protein [Neiella holothuriorum]MBW8189406.1 hypothetical protein [Neiella holothuriorum]
MKYAFPILIICMLCLLVGVDAKEQPLYETSAGMDRKCLYLAKQMNRTIKKLKKQPIDQRQLEQDLEDYQEEWAEHDCQNNGKNVR